MKILLAATLALVLTSCQTMQSVDRGLYGLSNQVSSQDRITGARSLNVTARASQIQQGNQAAAQAISKYEKKDATLDSTQYNRAKRIFDRILKASHMAGESWQIHLIPEESFNAFVTGGTVIVIHQGLMKQLSSDDEVAAVLGHELAHVAANHVFERQAGQIAHAVGGGSSGKSGFVQAAYSRTDETEADNIGILYMALAGYNPDAAAVIWQRMYQLAGTNGQMVSSHPMNSDRMKNAQAIAAKVKQYYKAGVVNPQAQDILNNNVLYAKRQAAGPAAGQGGGLASVLETAANFYIGKQQAKMAASQEVNRIGSLQQIQKDLQIVESGRTSNGQLGIGLNYVGARSVSGLSLKAVTEKGQAMYRHNGVVQPNTRVNAVFDSSIVNPAAASSSGQQIKLIVDEGNYL